MRRLYAAVLGLLALFAFSALAAPDMGKVKFGAYVLTGTVAYAMPSVSPPLAVENAAITVDLSNPTIGGTPEATTSTQAVPALAISSFDTAGRVPEYHRLL